MKITSDYFLNFLIKFKKESTCHENYKKLNLQKLYLLSKYLKIENLITYDFQMKTFHLKPYLIESVNIDELKKEDCIRLYNHYFNLIINNLMIDLKTNQDYLCTTSTNEFIKNKLSIYVNDKIISSHIEQIKKVQKSMLSDILNILYGIENVINSVTTEESLSTLNYINFNVEVVDEEDIKILESELNDEDYF